MFLPYMGRAAILFNGAELFEQIIDAKSNKNCQTVSEKTFKGNTILYLYIAQGQGQIRSP